jgi:hypothetical protein
MKDDRDDANDRKLATAVDLSGFFREALAAALVESKVEASPPTEHYLVALLSDFAHPDELAQQTFERPLPLLLAEALDMVGHERFERLRTLGDAVLYTSGFFLDHLRTRGVQLSYVSSLGARAYDGAAGMLRQADRGSGEGPRAPELFEELAQNFTPYAGVLATLANSLLARSAQGTDSGALRVYEKWLETGSPELARALMSRGIAPIRGRGGVH